MHKRTLNKLVKKHISKGKRLLAKYKLNLAEKEFTKAIELNPNNAGAYKYRGDVYFLAEPEKAIEDYTKAVELKPNYIDAYKSRAILYALFLFDMPDEAISDYTTILNFNPNHFEAYSYRGEIYASLEQYDLSVKDYTKAIELKPQRHRLYICRGQNYYKMQDYESAIKDFSAAANSDEYYEKVDAYMLLAKICCKLQDYNRAIEFYTKTIEILKGRMYYDYLVKCYKKRSEAYMQLGEIQKANADLRLADEAEAELNKIPEEWVF